MTAVDLGSFSKASEVVGYTQSGLTHLVDSLEREIGLRLVRRDRSGVSLTREGEALMPSIREFLRENAKLENQIAAITDKKRDTIRVAAYASIAMHWMPEILYRFRRVCPNIDVDLRMVDNAIEPFELLEKGRTDVIFAAKQAGFSCDWTPLCQDAMYAILPPDYPLVKADFSLMEQVLVNLLLNACVHTPAGTPITLKGGADPARGQVWLDVHDLGPGIPPERAETIFERFRTTRPGGLGLGLPIVRGFMEAQHGAVSLLPVPAGTCFRLVFPLVEHDHVPEE